MIFIERSSPAGASPCQLAGTSPFLPLIERWEISPIAMGDKGSASGRIPISIVYARFSSPVFLEMGTKGELSGVARVLNPQ